MPLNKETKPNFLFSCNINIFRANLSMWFNIILNIFSNKLISPLDKVLFVYLMAQ